MKVLLVSPASKVDVMAKSRDGFLLAPLTLAGLAGLTPSDVEVEVQDELVCELDLETDADLVGITCSTDTCVRAYEVSGEFRRRGRRTVLGGIHPTLVPQEAAAHADAVVVGEAEPVWGQVLADAEADRLKPIYKAQKLWDLGLQPQPRWDAIDLKRYIPVSTIQATRGCPYGCDFCTVPVVHGRAYRRRPVDHVAEEMAGLPHRMVLFVDDNITGHKAYSHELFRAIAPLGKRWVGQASLDVHRSPDLLKAMADSGCEGLFVGIESVDMTKVLQCRKFHNVFESPEQMRNAVRTIRQHGISVLGSFVFGLDGDTAETFRETLDFAISSGMDAAQFTLLTPYPGTGVYDRLLEEGRLLSPHWWRSHHWTEVVYEPKPLAREALAEGCRRVGLEFYRKARILRRGIDTLFMGGAVRAFWLAKVNLSYRRSALADKNPSVRRDSALATAPIDSPAPEATPHPVAALEDTE